MKTIKLVNKIIDVEKSKVIYNKPLVKIGKTIGK